MLKHCALPLYVINIVYIMQSEAKSSKHMQRKTVSLSEQYTLVHSLNDHILDEAYQDFY